MGLELLKIPADHYPHASVEYEFDPAADRYTLRFPDGWEKSISGFEWYRLNSSEGRFLAALILAEWRNPYERMAAGA